MQAKKVSRWRVRRHTGGDPGEWSEGCWSSVMLTRWAEQTCEGVTVSLYHQEGDGPAEKRMMTESRCDQMASEVYSRINNWHINNQAKERKRGNYSFQGKDIIKMWLQYIAINNTDILMQTLNIDICLLRVLGKGNHLGKRTGKPPEPPLWFQVVVVQLLAQSCPTPRTTACQASPSSTIFHYLLTSIESMMPSNHLTSVFTPFFSCPQSSPASESFPISQSFSVRWPKCWSFSISPSNECSELISLGLTGLKTPSDT